LIGIYCAFWKNDDFGSVFDVFESEFIDFWIGILCFLECAENLKQKFEVD
jgi:pyoverdine/dityrosine biosynthesis protein Dit1